MPLARAAGGDAPRVLIDLFPFERLSAGVDRGEILHVTFKLAYQIRAWRPNRHHELFRRGHGDRWTTLDRDVDFKQVRVRARHRDRERDLRCTRRYRLCGCQTCEKKKQESRQCAAEKWALMHDGNVTRFRKTFATSSESNKAFDRITELTRGG